jgi:hypothetical protein
MTKNTQKAISKYGVENCRTAYAMHSIYGEGANTIGFYLGFTTRQADAAINAGRELARSSL